MSLLTGIAKPQHCNHADDEELQHCEECNALLCDQHSATYSHYVLCAKCHHEDTARLEILKHELSEMISTALNFNRYTEQDGRVWSGFIGCEDVMERIVTGIKDGTIAPEVTP